VRYIESYRSAVLDAQGRVEFVVAVARDVTERRRTEEALRARDVQLQEAQALATWAAGMGPAVQHAHLVRPGVRIFGLRPDQLPSTTFYGFYPLVHPRTGSARRSSPARR